MQRKSGVAPAVWRGLVQVVAGPAPAPALAWSWRSRPARTALIGVTLAMCFISATHVHRVASADATPPPSLWQALLAVLVVLPLPLAARDPMLAWRAGWLGLLLSPLVGAGWWGGWPWGPAQVLALLGVFCLAAVRQPRAALWWMWALTLVPWCLWLAIRIPDLNGPVSATLVFTAAAIAMDSIGSRLRTQRALVAQTSLTEAEQARLAVLEERTRIARELHDVVAHHMSLIAVRAETAPYRLPALPAEALEEFGALSSVARESMAEMRRLLGVLRQDRLEPAELEPQPELADVPALVDAARRAGVTISLSVPASLGKVPGGVGVCAYRIVQESLSNATQHAAGAPVTVSLEHSAGAVELRVANGPVPSLSWPSASGSTAGSGPGGRGPGHGLTGMHERVALLGGSLSAGPTPAGGFVVSAVLPLGGPA
jgi:signal transduction histidine kinase